MLTRVLVKSTHMTEFKYIGAMKSLSISPCTLSFPIYLETPCFSPPLVRSYPTFHPLFSAHSDIVTMDVTYARITSLHGT